MAAQVIVEMSGDEAKLWASMQRVVQQNSKVEDSFKKVKKSGDALGDFGKRVKSEILGMAAGYASVATAVNLVTTAHQQMIAKQDESLKLAREIAAAQQEAAKNLAGESQETISKVLLEKVPEIAKKTVFSDLGKITTALGSASSIVGEKRAVSAVETSAELTRFTPEDLQSTTTSVADVMKASNLESGKEAMSMLLSAGAVARPEELPKLASGASKAIYAGVNASPTQAPEEAAKESAALYAVFSKVDKQGESASTAAIQFIEMLRTTFQPTREEAATRDERMLELQRSSQVPLSEQVDLQQAFMQMSRMPAGTIFAKEAQGQFEKISRSAGLDESEQGELKKMLSELSVSTQAISTARTPEAKDAARRAAMDAEDRLNQFYSRAGLTRKEDLEFAKIQTQKGLAAQDPGTLRGRLEAVQKSPILLREAESNLKGEAAFKPIAQGFFDPNSEHMKGLNEAFEKVTTDVTVFDEAVKSVEMTPQQQVALSTKKIDTQESVRQFEDISGANAAAFREIEEKALGATNVDYTTAIGSSLPSLTRPMTDPSASAEYSVNVLRDREGYLRSKERTPDLEKRLETLVTAIESIVELSKKNPAISQESIDRMTKTLEQTRDSVNKAGDKTVGAIQGAGPQDNSARIQNQHNAEPKVIKGT